MMGALQKGESMTDYKPGTVALIHLRDGSVVRAFRTDLNRGVRAWTGVDLRYFLQSDIVRIDPLVELNPIFLSGPSGEVAAALRLLGNRAATHIADQIEEQTRPARIPEPGIWGIVEASISVDPKRRKYVRHSAGTWFSMARGLFEWDDLIDPVLVREGVE
jgi:hypothetical protein